MATCDGVCCCVATVRHGGCE
ncbi:hypothetical protein E2C01_072023 [Portunus trituberculatus]|uniref:Uncharacterized protein n=1 Tax=Portunus trituberculatus TaxID=210409 RepID=A0A5B7I6N4_PORTR|nr:hypothetical protein [Portunus trituberculatus]